MTTTQGASETQQRAPSQATSDTYPDLATMSRHAHRALLSRLTDDVIAAVGNDESAVPEAAKLTAWLQADFLPWVHDRQVQATDPALRTTLRADRLALGELQNELSEAYGAEAADLARALYRDAKLLLARLD